MRPEPRAVPGLPGALPDLEFSLLDDRSPRNVVRVAEAFWLAGEPKRAIRLLELLLSEHRETIAARILLGWCYEAAERPLDADRVWADVARLDPENPFAGRLGETEAAEPADAEPEDEDEGEPLVGRAPPPVESEPAPPAEEAPRDAEHEAEPEAELTPADLEHVPPAHLYSATLAEIFERQGFAEKALEIYREIVRQHPERQDLVERIQLLEAGAGEEPAS
jgi:tetratricopeptide (TPR) repeat protein